MHKLKAKAKEIFLQNFDYAFHSDVHKNVPLSQFYIPIIIDSQMVLVLIGEVLLGNSLLGGLASDTTPLLHERECACCSGL